MKYYIQKLGKGACVLIFGILFSMTGFAATYYVSNEGSDSNNGLSSGSPWLTLGKVNAASLSAGDAVLFRSGDSWYGQLIPKSGSSSARITYGAYGTGDKPLIHAALTKKSTGDWVNEGSNIWRSASTYSTEIGNVFLNNSMAGVRKYSDGALSSQGHYYYNTSTDYIKIYSTSNPASYYSDIKLLSAVILVSLNNKSNINIKDLNLSYTAGYSVVGNTCSNIALSNLTMIWIGGQTHAGEVRKGNAVEFWNNCQNAVVENCIVGEVFDAGLSNQGDNATQTNITYRKNIIYNCEYSYEYFLRGGTTSNIVFENNTCVDAGLGWGHKQRTGPTGRHIRIAGTPPGTTNFVVRNNIFSNALDVLNYTRDIEGQESQFKFNYNAYYQTMGSNVAQIKMVYYSTFPAYQSATGWEANSINANPLFVDAANHDYRLASNSPCIDAGDPSSPKDANGSRSDMGALESGSSAPVADATPPVISAFTVPATSSSLTVALTTFTATDNVGVTGYLVSETATTPSLTTTGWSSTVPTSYVALTAGTKNLYAWARDAAGNISPSVTRNVVFSQTSNTLPNITEFLVPATASSLTVPISSFKATHSTPVTGYLVSETAATPSLSDSKWSSTVPTSYVALTAGTKNLYAWVRDAAGNISPSVTRNVVITLASSSDGSVYYLSPTGSDASGNGTINSPWFTLNKAWTVVKAGDIVYLRGGNYLYTSGQKLHSKSGTAANRIKVWAMPGEQPVIAPAASYGDTRGIDIRGNFIHLKGLEIKDYKQRTSSALYYGLVAENSNSNIYEQLSVHDNGFGLSLGSDSGDNLVLNSDFYRNADPMSNFGGNVPYGGADGITIRSSNLSSTNIIRGCRMWWNSDDGVDLFENQGTIIIENSWSFWNGFVPGTFNTAGNGDGFKMGITFTDLSTSVKRIIRNNLAFENRTIGFDQNNARCITQLYNNTSYNNAHLGTAARSFNFWNGTAATVAKNNLDFKQSMSALFNSQADVSHNSFQKNGSVNTSHSVTAADFLSLDPNESGGVTGPRQADGSLPNLNFLKLAPGSDLINKGTNVGLPFSGSAPDLGAYESAGSTVDAVAPVVTAFAVPPMAFALRVPVIAARATDNIKVTGCMLTETPTAPSPNAPGWTNMFPMTYVFSSPGAKTLYAWARDAAGNVSASRNDRVTVLRYKSAEIAGDIIDSTQLAGSLSPSEMESPLEMVKIDVFPNPCVDQVTVRFSQTPEPGSKIEIIDITGKKVAAREIVNSNESFSMGQFPSGLYMVKTLIGSNEVITKLIRK